MALTLITLEKIALQYKIAFGAELIRQGQTKRSGSLVESLKSETHLGYPTTIRFFGNHYWRFLNYGVSSGHITKPYAYPRIEGLIKWLKRKGIGSGDDKIRGIAFAIATVHAKRGMPTRGGRRDESRMNFVDKAIDKNRSKIQQTIAKNVGRDFSQLFVKLHR